ncbi:hypothetical protein P7K49_028905 [Saguinus oedipus]|uniref:Uncharacterized protein n=1 Tax=Saguinus oedipus TaxID=9490 RepID=A0ABQ9U7R7_SAGOE|nr:hypothetical protein P7K49_028905 [Saguinus oedipus]
MSTQRASRVEDLPVYAVLSETRRDREERRPCTRAPPPQPFPCPCSASGVRRAPHLFQGRHQQSSPLGRVLFAEKLVGQLLRLHGAPGAPLGGERGGGGPAGEPREGEVAARNRAAAPPDGPAPSGRRAAGLALARGLKGEVHAQPPTRHGYQPWRTNAARRRRHPAPPPRGQTPPAPPWPAGAAPGGPLRRRRLPGLHSRVRPGPAAELAAGGRRVEGRSGRGARSAQLELRNAGALGRGGAGGGGSCGEGEGPEVVVGESGCPEVPPPPPPV